METQTTRRDGVRAVGSRAERGPLHLGGFGEDREEFAERQGQAEKVTSGRASDV